jgi:hypothetical protein
VIASRAMRASRLRPLLSSGLLFLAAGLACHRGAAITASPDGATIIDAGADAIAVPDVVADQAAPEAGPETGVDADTADASPDTLVADAAPATLSPRDLGARLALWLDASKGVTAEANKVNQWLDQSDHRHVAKPVGPGPWLTSDQLGHPAVRFGLSGNLTTRLLVADDPSLRWGRGDFTLCVVARYRNVPSHANVPHDYGLLVAKVATDNPPYPGPGLWGNNPWPANLGTGSETTQILFQTVGLSQHVVATESIGFNNDKVQLMMGMRKGAQLRLRVNGFEARKDLAEVADISATGFPLSLGAHPNFDGQQLDGDIFEVVALSSSLGDDELQALERYFADKFALAGIP